MCQMCTISHDFVGLVTRNWQGPYQGKRRHQGNGMSALIVERLWNSVRQKRFTKLSIHSNRTSGKPDVDIFEI